MYECETPFLSEADAERILRRVFLACGVEPVTMAQAAQPDKDKACTGAVHEKGSERNGKR